MSIIQLVPTILSRYLQNQDYSEQLGNLEFLDDEAFRLVRMMLNNPRLRELLNELTNNRDEQLAMLMALYRSTNNLNLLQELQRNIVENVLDLFRTALLNRRGQQINAEPGSPIRFNDREGMEPPGAPGRPRRTRPVGEEGRNVRARRNQEDEEYFDRLPFTIRYPVNPLIPDNFVETIINNFHLEGNDECKICYTPLNEEPVCMVYECGHVFHCRCINNWRSSLASNRNTCPVCRQPISQIIDNVQLPGSSGGSGFGKRSKQRLHQVDMDIRYLKSI